MDHSKQTQASALSRRSGGDTENQIVLAERQDLSPDEWGEVQATVHALDPAGYSPEQAALVARARAEFLTIETSVGRMAQPLMEQLVEGLNGTWNDLAEENWRELGKMQAQFGYFTAPILERLPIEQILICYLQLLQVQTYYQQLIADSDSTPIVIAEIERRITRMQSAFNRQSEALARLRRLSTPTPLQINIGGQQVNVAGGSLPTFP